MLQQEKIFRKKELFEMFSQGEIKSLEEIHLIEDTALMIKNLEHDIELYKLCKQKKIKDISDAIKIAENKIDFYRKVILATLKRFKEKKIDFPGTCKIFKRKVAKNWEIKDEEALIKILLDMKENGENINEAYREKVEKVIDSKRAKQLLFDWEESGKLDNILGENKNNIVEKKEESEAVSLSFYERKDDDDDIEEYEEFLVEKENPDDFDSLTKQD